jgi:hypothetical protein
MSRKKLFVAIIGLAMISVTGLVALNDTWTSCTISMHASTASTVSLAQFEECLLTTPLNGYDWLGVNQGETYQMEYYLRNTGTVGLYITYLPTDLSWDNNQVRMSIAVKVIEWGNVPCQMFPIEEDGQTTVNPPNFLPEKDAANPSQGYFLGPGKIVKLRVELTVMSVTAGGFYQWEFAIHGVNV